MKVNVVASLYLAAVFEMEVDAEGIKVRLATDISHKSHSLVMGDEEPENKYRVSTIAVQLLAAKYAAQIMSEIEKFGKVTSEIEDTKGVSA